MAKSTLSQLLLLGVVLTSHVSAEAAAPIAGCPKGTPVVDFEPPLVLGTTYTPGSSFFTTSGIFVLVDNWQTAAGSLVSGTASIGNMATLPPTLQIGTGRHQ
jgi:hypothetical protein